MDAYSRTWVLMVFVATCIRSTCPQCRRLHRPKNSSHYPSCTSIWRSGVINCFVFNKSDICDTITRRPALTTGKSFNTYALFKGEIMKTEILNKIDSY
ncbi:uncharacterized protein EV420DRAFT_1125311 [Desarmillaria tabescens]|uniref:Secreted protein n=1 Tax=Armillaria tabescens TaxID=1929756 RepID=A0AA39MNE5_ARMTA|nr:uncharacterized protein EV420DRAFT_1125311 [Desarmillaria tabescens]KAK0441181.1 hypothetical protein EV420DRAFT_1125311 [Desarmillaria tabescens]